MESESDSSQLGNQNQRCKLIMPDYSSHNQENYVIFQSPTIQQLHEEHMDKITKPFTHNVNKLLQQFEEIAARKNLDIKIKYVFYRKFEEDENSIPKRFRICCSKFFGKKCKAYYHYVFDEEERCYYLKNAINQHFHDLESKTEKEKENEARKLKRMEQKQLAKLAKKNKKKQLRRSKFDNFTPQQILQYHRQKKREYFQTYKRNRQRQRQQRQQRLMMESQIANKDKKLNQM